MIIDLKLAGKKAVIVGGGREAQKRARALLGEGCEIVIIAKDASPAIRRMAAAKKARLRTAGIRDAGFISELRPDLVIAATDDTVLNEKITRAARRRKILAYRADDSKDSDFANPAVIRIGGVLKAGIFTGGRSPAMAKKLRAKSETALRGAITREDIARIRIQDYARRKARDSIKSQPDRREYLRRVMADGAIDQLIKDGQLRRAQMRAAAMLGDWK